MEKTSESSERLHGEDRDGVADERGAAAKRRRTDSRVMAVAGSGGEAPATEDTADGRGKVGEDVVAAKVDLPEVATETDDTKKGEGNTEETTAKLDLPETDDTKKGEGNTGETTAKLDLPEIEERGLPWLILPSFSRQPLYHSTSEHKTYELQLPEDIKASGEFCGSFQGGWTFVKFGDPLDKTIIYNLKTGERVDLPTTLKTAHTHHPVKVETAAIWGSPDAETYIVAAVLRPCYGEADDLPNIAYWCSTETTWSFVDELWEEVLRDDLSFEDVMYSEGSFLFLTETEDIKKLTVTVEPNGQVSLGNGNFSVAKRIEYSQELQDNVSVQRYLVDSGDGIMMVLKYQQHLHTSHVRLFRLHSDNTSEEVSSEDSDELFYSANKVEPDYYWLDQDQDLDLDYFHHKLFFVGRAASRVFDADGYDAEPRPRLAFFDDRGVKEGGRFRRADMGMFVLPDGGLQEWPPAGGEAISARSDRYPPTWLIP